MKVLSQCTTDSYGSRTFEISDLRDGEEVHCLWLDEMELMTYLEEGNKVVGAEMKDGKLKYSVQSSEKVKVAAAKVSLMSGCSVSFDSDMLLTSLSVPRDGVVFDCGKVVMGICSDVAVSHSVTIVIHDETAEAHTFSDFVHDNLMRDNTEVFLDLNLVKDEDVLKNVYGSFAYNFLPNYCWLILDNADRKKEMLSWAYSEIYDEVQAEGLI